MSIETPLIQLIEINDHVIPVGMMNSIAIVHSTSLDSPRCIVKFVDEDGDLRVVAGIRDDGNSILTITYGDIYAESGTLWQEKFTVIDVRSKGHTEIQVEGLQSDIFNTKKRISRPRFFINMRPSAIIQQLFELEVVSDGAFPLYTLHVNAGGTAAASVRAMAKDLGAAVYYFKNKIYLLKLSELAKRPATQQLEYLSNQPNQIHINNLALAASEMLISRELDVSGVSWDRQKGIVSIAADAPPVFLAGKTKAQLTQRKAYQRPVLLCDATGTTTLAPSDKVKIRLNRWNTDIVIDETFPEEMHVIEISNCQIGNRYFCKLTLGVING